MLVEKEHPNPLNNFFARDDYMYFAVGIRPAPDATAIMNFFMTIPPHILYTQKKHAIDYEKYLLFPTLLLQCFLLITQH